MRKMNKLVNAVNNQVINTLDRLQSLGYVYYYNPPDIYEDKKKSLLLCNNHQSMKETSEKYFLRPEQYCALISTNDYWALLKDYSIIRGSFEFEKNKLIKESLLWWPCPVLPDRSMVEELGLDESVKLLFNDKNTISRIRMRTPMRVDFDVNNDSEMHPRAHMHMQSVETRINTCEPICFNRFMEYILLNYYSEWKIKFDKREFISFTYEKKKRIIEYNRSVKLCF